MEVLNEIKKNVDLIIDEIYWKDLEDEEILGMSTDFGEDLVSINTYLMELIKKIRYFYNDGVSNDEILSKFDSIFDIKMINRFLKQKNSENND